MNFSYYSDIIDFEHSWTYLAEIGELNAALNVFRVSKKDIRTTSIFPLYTPWDYQKHFVFLMFSGGIEKVHWNRFSYFMLISTTLIATDSKLVQFFYI